MRASPYPVSERRRAPTAGKHPPAERSRARGQELNGKFSRSLNSHSETGCCHAEPRRTRRRNVAGASASHSHAGADCFRSASAPRLRASACQSSFRAPRTKSICKFFAEGDTPSKKLKSTSLRSCGRGRKISTRRREDAEQKQCARRADVRLRGGCPTSSPRLRVTASYCSTSPAERGP